MAGMVFRYAPAIEETTETTTEQVVFAAIVALEITMAVSFTARGLPVDPFTATEPQLVFVTVALATRILVGSVSVKPTFVSG